MRITNRPFLKGKIVPFCTAQGRVYIPSISELEEYAGVPYTRNVPSIANRMLILTLSLIPQE